jgi:hypothetical protein
MILAGVSIALTVIGIGLVLTGIRRLVPVGAR